MPNVIMFAECHKSALYVECRYAECYNADCRNPECRGATRLIWKIWIRLDRNKRSNLFSLSDGEKSF
jgi:hypothetical protein